MSNSFLIFHLINYFFSSLTHHLSDSYRCIWSFILDAHRKCLVAVTQCTRIGHSGVGRKRTWGSPLLRHCICTYRDCQHYFVRNSSSADLIAHDSRSNLRQLIHSPWHGVYDIKQELYSFRVNNSGLFKICGLVQSSSYMIIHNIAVFSYTKFTLIWLGSLR
jgi:hypothetical protein